MALGGNEGGKPTPNPAETAPVQPLNIELSTRTEQESLFNVLRDHLIHQTQSEARYPDRVHENARRNTAIVRGIASQVGSNLGFDQTISVVEKIECGLFIDKLSETEIETVANDESNMAPTVTKAKYFLGRKREMNRGQGGSSK